MAKDDQEEFLGGGGLVLKFAEIGDNYTLKITEEPDIVPIHDFDDPAIVLTWPDGRVRKQMIIYGQLTEDSEGWLDDEEDTGERRLYVKGYMAGALKDALRAAKAKKVTPGGELYVEFSEEGEAKTKRHKPPKFFDMEWESNKYSVTSTNGHDDASEFENEEAEDEAPAPRARGRKAAAAPVAKAAPARGRGRAKAAEEEVPAVPRRGRGKAAATETVTDRSAARSAARKKAAEAAADHDDPAVDDEPPY